MSVSGGLLHCSVELLLSMYMLLNNINNVLHLARSSKQLCAVFDRYQLEITRNIEVRAVKHKCSVSERRV